MSAVAAAIGRILIALIFIFSGANKLITLNETNAMITAAGLPGGLALPTAIFELVTGLFLALGILTRLVSILLAGFTALTILFFHNQVTDPMQAAMAMKNIAIIGGLLVVFAYGQMRWSYDHMRAARRNEEVVRQNEIAARDADARAHDAELRAARAEAVAAERKV